MKWGIPIEMGLLGKPGQAQALLLGEALRGIAAQLRGPDYPGHRQKTTHLDSPGSRGNVLSKGLLLLLFFSC